MGNKTKKRGHRPKGALTNADHADEWQELARQIREFFVQFPTPRGRPRGDVSSVSVRGLAAAMGLGNSTSTLYYMLAEKPRKNGAVVPGADKIAAARSWLANANSIKNRSC